ncbi:MAG: hypothetical protein ACI84K_001514 [Pseudohongiellaceae bacterium]
MPSAINGAANTPYFIGKHNTSIDFKILSQLSPPATAKEITNLSLSFGSDNTLALADVTAKVKEYNVGLIGASTAVYANRIGGFAGAVLKYQTALLDYRNTSTSNSLLKATMKQQAYTAFE